MKKKVTTTSIILIVLIIGLIGSGVALHLMHNNDSVEPSTTTNSSITTTTESTSAEEDTTLAPSTTEENAQTSTTTNSNEYIGITGEITVNEAFNKLEEYYGKGYEINCRNANVQKPIFIATNTSSGEDYARVQVDLSTAIANETILGTNEVKEFSLYG